MNYLDMLKQQQDMMIDGNIRNNFINSPYSEEVLDKIKILTALPDGNLTSQMVADYFEIPYETLQTCVKRNKEELEMNGMMFKK